MVRGVRGATTAEANTREAILSATKELLQEVAKANALNSAEVAAAFLTTSPDLNAEFPAVAARQMGWTEIPLLCGHEMAVPDGLRSCIRVLILVNTDKAQGEMNHIYLRGAVNLRNRGIKEE